MYGPPIQRRDRISASDQVDSAHRRRVVSAVGERFPVDSTANGKAAVAVASGAVADVAFDRDEHTPGISAAGIAGRVSGGQVVAISVPAPTERFLAQEDIIVAALRAALKSPCYQDDTAQ